MTIFTSIYYSPIIIIFYIFNFQIEFLKPSPKIDVRTSSFTGKSIAKPLSKKSYRFTGRVQSLTKEKTTQSKVDLKKNPKIAYQIETYKPSI